MSIPLTISRRNKYIIALLPLMVLIANMLLLRFGGVGVSTSTPSLLAFFMQLVPSSAENSQSALIFMLSLSSLSVAWIIFGILIPFIIIGQKPVLLKRFFFLLALLVVAIIKSLLESNSIALHYALGGGFPALGFGVSAFLVVFIAKVLFGVKWTALAYLRVVFLVVTTIMLAHFIFSIDVYTLASIFRSPDLTVFLFLTVTTLAIVIEHSEEGDVSSKSRGYCIHLLAITTALFCANVVAKHLRITPGAQFSGDVELNIDLGILSSFKEVDKIEQLFQYLVFSPEWNASRKWDADWEASKRIKKDELLQNVPKFSFGKESYTRVELEHSKHRLNYRDPLENYHEVKADAGKISLPVFQSNSIAVFGRKSNYLGLKIQSEGLTLKIYIAGPTIDSATAQKALDEVQANLKDALSMTKEQLPSRFAERSQKSGCYYKNPSNNLGVDGGTEIKIWGYINPKQEGTIKMAINDKPIGLSNKETIGWSNNDSELFYIFETESVYLFSGGNLKTEPQNLRVEVYFQPPRDFRSIKSEELKLIATCEEVK